MIWHLKDLQRTDVPQGFINGEWVVARPVNWEYRTFRTKVREAWLVFTGKTESFYWPMGQ